MRRRLAILLMASAVLGTACPNGGDEPPRATPSPIPTATPTPSPSPSPSPEPANIEDIDIRVKRIATLRAPLAMAGRRGDRTLYVAEQLGRVVAIRGGKVLSRPVLNLSEQVTSGGEQGLLGIAFSPGGRRLYVNYTDLNGHSRVVEYTMRGRRADPSTRRQLLFVEQPFANHNGGQLAFGPDGYLYIALGDGGAGGDPFDNGQSLQTLLGKVLRIDPRPGGGKPYRIPPDNPFVGKDDARPEIWAYGLRNPWRFSFDRETGDLWIGDVGQNAREEIDFQPAASDGGENYGWNLMEGSLPFASEAVADDTVPPIHEYDLRGGTCSVIGGYVYRGTRIPDLTGAYVFGDFCDGRIMALRQRGGKVRERGALGPAIEQLSSFGEDLNGELYALSLAGGVYRVLPT
ncbi:MAG TPA: PQQ-dependent sugar dehydrogenase [Actinomycetota bacterium]|nr:PQQ-dependent sugar dehydrogenase [Actinomycetota bacterium]